MRPLLGPAVPAMEYWLLRNRRHWRTQLTAMTVTPLLYLTALGFGVGTLVDDNVGAAGVQGVEYLVFLAPGILALTAMQQGFEESSWPVIGALRWWGTYPAQQVTRLRVHDLLTGHLLFIALKLTATVTIFTAVAALFGAFSSPWVLAAMPAAVLCGLAHAAPIAAFAITRRVEMSLAAFYRFVVLPMSLFSGAFFPVAQLPVGVEQLAYVTPLWHGVDLCRDLALEQGTFASGLGHVAYLLAWTVGGFVLAVRMYARRLAP
ncbi:ABC transporter permease [Sporichthya brevicatena]|uniref:Transport permease protein n=1 Tax=Sporichthya brevicatena TaxID=171442 RepID=A0ABN1H9Z4_9ACTN